MGRGTITDEIKEIARDKLGFENFSQKELRLLPYIQYVMMNNQEIEPERINQVEREFLARLRICGLIEGGINGLTITKRFWDIMNEILWLSYVDY